MRGGKEIVAAGGSVIAQDEATSVVWGMPGAAANAGICAAVLPLAQIARTGSSVFRRSFVTPSDYEFLRKLLKERSGLDLSADKQYLVESRLIPLARRMGLAGITELVAKLKGGADRYIRCGRGDDHERDVLLPRQDFHSTICGKRYCRR